MSYPFNVVSFVVLLLRPEPGLSQGSVEVVVTTPASLQQLVRKEIDSVLKCSSNVTSLDPSASVADNLVTLINSVNAITEKLDTLQRRLDLLHQPRGSSSSNPATSCAEILHEYPASMSGYYWIKNATDHPHNVFCAMRSCAGVYGAWMRLVSLNMKNHLHQCPSSLHQRTISNVRLCTVKSDLHSCSSAYFTSHGIHYSTVCGRIRGYHIKSPDGFFRSANHHIDNYVDGVSLMTSSEYHIWTFAAKYKDPFPGPTCSCGPVPAFVGNNYFCDGHQIHTTNVVSALWNGRVCDDNPCCSFNNPPWFSRRISHTTDDIEMRLCRDQHRSDEDIAVNKVEIYVQ